MSFGPNCAALSGNHHCLRAEAPGGWILGLAKIMFSSTLMMWLFWEVYGVGCCTLVSKRNYSQLISCSRWGGGQYHIYVYGCFKEEGNC